MNKFYIGDTVKCIYDDLYNSPAITTFLRRNNNRKGFITLVIPGSNYRPACCYCYDTAGVTNTHFEEHDLISCRLVLIEKIEYTKDIKWRGKKVNKFW